MKALTLFLPYNPKVVVNKNERVYRDAQDDIYKDMFSAACKEQFLGKCKIPKIMNLKELYPLSQKESLYSQKPYGAIGTIGGAGCALIAFEHALRTLGYEIPFERLIEETVKKGYRAYVFDEQGKITDGDGTEQALFDECARQLMNPCEIISALMRYEVITLLISNATYHNDIKRRGNHFINLLGFDENEQAILVDGNMITNGEDDKSIVEIPAKHAFTGIKGAWAWNKRDVRRLFI